VNVPAFTRLSCRFRRMPRAIVLPSFLMVHALVSLIARTLCLVLVAGLVAGAMLAPGPGYEAAAPSLSAQVHDKGAETAEPSRLCTAGHACALLAGAAPMSPPGLSAGAMQPPRSLTASPKCDDAPPVQPPRTTA
jgi:hypothetical protein